MAAIFGVTILVDYEGILLNSKNRTEKTKISEKSTVACCFWISWFEFSVHSLFTKILKFAIFNALNVFRYIRPRLLSDFLITNNHWTVSYKHYNCNLQQYCLCKVQQLYFLLLAADTGH